MKKLTLSVDESVLRSARRLARAQGTSISAMFSRLVRAMARRKEEAELPPLTARMSGILTVPKGKSDRQLIEEALDERYGLDR